MRRARGTKPAHGCQYSAANTARAATFSADALWRSLDARRPAIDQTGLRRGEALKLRWSSVDFNRRLLTVEGRNAKNRQTRHVPLNDEAVSVLRNWREQSGTGRVRFVSPLDFGRLVARSSSGP